MLRNCTLIAVLILFFQNAFAQTSNTAKYPSLFWEITGNGLKKPSYLFGTMHVSNKIAFHLSDSFYNAIQSTDMVALELNPEYWQKDMVKMNAAQEEIENFYRDNTTQYLTESSFAITDYYDKLKPALTAEPQQINSLLYRTFSIQQDYEENTYLDLYIYQTGRKYGKLAGGVEDYYQTQKILFEAYAAMAKERMKRSNNRDATPDIDKKIQEAYRHGNLDLLDSLEHLSFNSPAYVNKFLYARNKIQANSIDSLVKKHSLFVGVGAAHLPGPNGVIELLRKKGYKLRPIYMQDRDATAKEAVEKMKVPVNFKSFTTDDGFISVKMPGPLYRMPQTYRTISDNWQYADMDNGAYYMLTRVKTHAGLLNQNVNTVLQKTDSLLYENIPGRIISKKTIKKDGVSGFDIVNRTRRGDLQRYNILVTPFEILIFKMSGINDYAGGTEADTFFNSIHFNQPSASQPAFASTQAGFHINFPQFPHINKNSYDADNIEAWQFEANDSTTGNAYAVYKKTVTNLNFMEEDTFDLSLVELSLKSSDIIDKELSRSFTKVEGFDALKMQFACKNGNYINAEAVLKGPDYYLVIQTSRKKNTIDAAFFNSFGFDNYQYNTSTTYTDTLLDFTVQTPVKPLLDSSLVNLMYSVLHDASLLAKIQGESYWPKNKYAMFKSDSTGESVLVSMYEYPKYYHVKDSATYWNKQLKPGNDDDTYLYKKTAFTADACQGYKLYWRDTNTVRQIINYKILSNNRLYNLYTITDTTGVESSFIKNFFSTFTVINKDTASIYTDKTNLFFEDLYSKDSITKALARNAISNVYYGAGNIDKVVNFINNLNYGEEDYFEMKQKFIAELGYINDSCCKNKIVHALKDIYTSTADTAYFQNAVLKALQHIQTDSSYAALKNLLLQDPPLFDDYDAYGDFFENFEDSLQLTRTLFPEILQLTTIEDYKEPVIALLSELLDSGYIKANDYKDYFSKIYFDAKIEMKKLQNAEEKLLEQQSQQNYDDDDSVIKNRYSKDDYETNDINEYAALLLPFYDTIPALPKFFNRLLQSRDTSVQLETAVLLIKNNKPVPDSILMNIAAKDNYRSDLFKALDDINRIDIFPSKYKQQDLMARSLLTGDTEKIKLFDIKPEGKTLANINGKKGYVYFFKYKLQKDDDWEIALSGPQPENTHMVNTDDALTSLTNEKIITGKPLAEQFSEQLSRLLLLQHKSARHFYENNKNMYGNFDDY